MRVAVVIPETAAGEELVAEVEAWTAGWVQAGGAGPLGVGRRWDPTQARAWDGLVVAWREGPPPAAPPGVHPLAFRAVRLQGDGHDRLRLSLAAVRLATSPALLEAPAAGEGRTMSRRDLLQAWAGPRRFRPWPALEAARCAAGQGCRVCAAACPREALTWPEGRPAPGERCDGCGSCAAACPTGAMTVRDLSDATVDALARVRATDPQGALRAVCPRDDRPEAEGEVLLPVPCVGALAPAQLARLRRSGPVTARCPDPGCPRQAAAARALAWLAWLEAGEPAPPGEPAAGAAAAPWSGRVRALATDLAAWRFPAGVEPPALAPEPGWPAWQVRVDGQRCTLCAACARACPTPALGLAGAGPEAWVLAADAGACLGCGRCAAVCPEGALTVEPASPQVLTAGPRALVEEGVVRCRSCGSVLGTRRQLAVLAERLGRPLPEPPLCDQCRLQASLGVWGTGPDFGPGA
ncbi:conserved protein of unknown function [Candidatus Hydrogenisulfobacillus filiaventi]|uniref:Ferredoxin n=1 Tax=Candidatus Hydrogenisulfobacillus filiaventi TaxID=2707344 RepID=A0A6F8ZI05_9FIRM|nr:conserved protein of unknown function [Candidatus Hydrogenisulfobacillus filiaventi]